MDFRHRWPGPTVQKKIICEITLLLLTWDTPSKICFRFRPWIIFITRCNWSHLDCSIWFSIRSWWRGSWNSKDFLSNQWLDVTQFFSTNWALTKVALLYFCTFKIRTSLEVKCEIYSCVLEPRSMDSLGHQHCPKKLSPEIALHLKWSVKVKQRYHRIWSEK